MKLYNHKLKTEGIQSMYGFLDPEQKCSPPNRRKMQFLQKSPTVKGFWYQIKAWLFLWCSSRSWCLNVVFWRVFWPFLFILKWLIFAPNLWNKWYQPKNSCNNLWDITEHGDGHHILIYILHHILSYTFKIWIGA